MGDEACGGKNKWRRTVGCLDPRTATREPSGDLPCDVVPDVYASGYCDCEDGIPRFRRCGAQKRACDVACSEPPHKSRLTAAFASSASKGSEGTAGSGSAPKKQPQLSTASAALALCAAVVFALLVRHVWGLLSTRAPTLSEEMQALVRRQRQVFH